MNVQFQASLTKQAIIQAYDHQRRVNAALFIGSIFSAILSLVLVALVLYALVAVFPSSQRIGLWVAIGVLLSAEAVFILGTIAANKKRVEQATGMIITATYVSLISLQIGWIVILGKGLDPVGLVMLALNGVALVVTGILGSSTLLLQMTLVTNILTLIVMTIVLSPASLSAANSSYSAIFAKEQAPIITLALLEQYIFAGIMVGINLLLEQLFRDLGEAYYQVQRLDTLKDQFIMHVNHEMRTPLMALQGFVELARRRNGYVATADLSRLLDKAAQASIQIVSFVNSVLSVSHLEQSTEFTPEQVDVRLALLSALDLIDPREDQMGGRDIKLSLSPGVAIWGDSQRMQQILSNLISNALKYSKPDTPIEVTAHPMVVQASGNQGKSAHLVPEVEITIRDYGLGIPPEQLGLLFHRFVRLPRDLASTVNGNGLGLFLCKQFTEAMGGKLWVESAGIEGQGSTFFIRLPSPPLDTSHSSHSTP